MPILDLLWPAQCAGCGVSSGALVCPACTPPGLHRVRLAVPGITGAWALCGYDAGLGRAIVSAKSQGDLGLMRTLAVLLADRVRPAVVDADFTAVHAAPSLPWSRLRRGFGGANVLAAAVGRTSGLPVRHDLFRLGGTRQHGHGRAARTANLRGRVRCEVPQRGRVLLVDDVITTGATAAACAAELLGAGAREVWVVAVAAVRDPPRPSALPDPPRRATSPPQIPGERP